MRKERVEEILNNVSVVDEVKLLSIASTISKKYVDFLEKILNERLELISALQEEFDKSCGNCKHFLHQDFIGTCINPKVAIGYKNLPDSGISIEQANSLTVDCNFSCKNWEKL
jgi:hypothetical protein